jgi:hypothetical protein
VSICLVHRPHAPAGTSAEKRESFGHFSFADLHSV